VTRDRPCDPAYAAYAYLHVRDLIDRYSPDVLWNDIEWPDAGKHDRSLGLAELFRYYYERAPEGVVNGRWGNTHWDFRTSEYQARLDHETGGAWEKNRGIGLSFGYNQLEDADTYLDGSGIIRHLLDKVSRGGNLLLNVGPDAAGRLPAPQVRALEEVGRWMAVNGHCVHDAVPVGLEGVRRTEEPWVRWTRTGSTAHAVIEARGPVAVTVDASALDLDSARLPDGTPVPARAVDGGIEVELPPGTVAGPVVVDLWLLRGPS
jgi:alpha-L-fucosidase